MELTYMESWRHIRSKEEEEEEKNVPLDTQMRLYIPFQIHDIMIALP